MWVLFSGIFLGLALGANDAANVFGPAVSSNILKFRTAAILTGLFIIIGAICEGEKGLETVGNLTSQTTLQAFICMLSAGIVVALMTYLTIPVSSSQAVIGAVIGSGFVGSGINFEGLQKIIICWIGTPIGAAIISYVIFFSMARIIKKCRLNFFQLDNFIRCGLIICCVYGAYALGANNVGNTTGVFVGAGIITPFPALLIGGLSISFGVITFSKNIIKTIGKSIVPLDGFSSFIALFSSALTVHFYSVLGVPVSTSQAIIGAVLGIGITRSFHSINWKALIWIFTGWVLTPILSIVVAIVVMKLIM